MVSGQQRTAHSGASHGNSECVLCPNLRAEHAGLCPEGLLFCSESAQRRSLLTIHLGSICMLRCHSLLVAIVKRPAALACPHQFYNGKRVSSKVRT